MFRFVFTLHYIDLLLKQDLNITLYFLKCLRIGPNHYYIIRKDKKETCIQNVS